MTLTDANGNKFTSAVKSINADGTIEFEDALECEAGVECDFSKGITVDFSDPEAVTDSVTEAFQKSSPFATAVYEVWQKDMSPVPPAPAPTAAVAAKVDAGGAAKANKGHDHASKGGGKKFKLHKGKHAKKGPKVNAKEGAGAALSAAASESVGKHRAVMVGVIGVFGVACATVGILAFVKFGPGPQADKRNWEHDGMFEEQPVTAPLMNTQKDMMPMYN